MKRIVGIVVGLMGLAAAACQPVPPPAGYVPPVIDSLTFSPSTVTAGSSVTITLRAHDDIGITKVGNHAFGTPSGATLPAASTSCTPYDVQPDGPGAVVATTTCVIPAFAPSGAWTYVVDVYDDVNLPGRPAFGGFQVVGGSSDAAGPSVVSVQYQPSATAPRQSWVVVTVRATDATLPVLVYDHPLLETASLSGPGGVNLLCFNPSSTAIAADTVDISIRCSVGLNQAVGSYTGSLRMTDAVGNVSSAPLAIDVI